VRIGLRYVAGLRSETGHATEVERRRAGFESVADLAKRVALHRDELDALAEVGALGSIDPTARQRRSALWQIATVERDRNSLFAGISPPAEPSPLEELSPLEATLTDYRTSGLTTGPHLLAHLRPELRRRGILAAAQLRSTPDGRFVRTAGHAIVRQRPRAAKARGSGSSCTPRPWSRSPAPSRMRRASSTSASASFAPSRPTAPCPTPTTTAEPNPDRRTGPPS
jgi:error-prone DNA polymerase